MGDERVTRRRYLGALGTVAVAGFTGCSGVLDRGSTTESTPTTGSSRTTGARATGTETRTTGTETRTTDTETRTTGTETTTGHGPRHDSRRDNDRKTTTPIKHIVVLFQENVSFDHYFATYPHAKNPDGEPAFHPKSDTPNVNGLNDALRNHNPNSANPQRLSRAHALTADQNHDYTAEQKAFDHGRMDEFVEYTGGDGGSGSAYSHHGLVMDYYDGNTVTALWNYAQAFAMSDNFYGTVTGPSTLGALNLVSGQTHGGYAVDPHSGKKTNASHSDAIVAPNHNGVGTVIDDADPAFDDRSSQEGASVAMTGKNIGSLLNDNDVSWGWFQGGFDPDGTHENVGDQSVSDYSPHHAAFQYYESTANPHHTGPSSLDEIGRDGRANHQYDLSKFYAALEHGSLPAVSFLKAARYQNGHAGYSDPLDEQHYVVTTINKIQRSAYWDSTAVVIAYDDSDGWYDHRMPPRVNSSQTKYDVLTSDGRSGNGKPLGGYQGRYGYGPRLPLLVISPHSRVNAVDHSVTDQTSILRFIEDNWDTGRIGDGSFDQLAGSLDGLFDFGGRGHDHRGHRADRVFLDPKTGTRKN